MPCGGRVFLISKVKGSSPLTTSTGRTVISQKWFLKPCGTHQLRVSNLGKSLKLNPEIHNKAIVSPALADHG